MIAEDMPVAFRALVGSHAYGLARPDSDYDYREVFITPTSLLVGILPRPKDGWQSEHRDTDDMGGWELGKWLTMVEKGSPNATELIWAPAATDDVDTLGHLDAAEYELAAKAIAVGLLTVPEVARATIGYATNSFRKIEEKPTKWLTGYLRSLDMGLELLTTGVMSFPSRSRTLLEHVQTRRLSAGEVLDKGQQIINEINQIARGELPSALPMELTDDDKRALNEDLIRIRKVTW